MKHKKNQNPNHKVLANTGLGFYLKIHLKVHSFRDEIWGQEHSLVYTYMPVCIRPWSELAAMPGPSSGCPLTLTRLKVLGGKHIHTYVQSGSHLRLRFSIPLYKSYPNLSLQNTSVLLESNQIFCDIRQCNYWGNAWESWDSWATQQHGTWRNSSSSLYSSHLLQAVWSPFLAWVSLCIKWRQVHLRAVQSNSC